MVGQRTAAAPNARPLLSVRQAGELLGITKSTAYRWLYNCQLKGAARRRAVVRPPNSPGVPAARRRRRSARRLVLAWSPYTARDGHT
jgi:hypothetical protein